VALPWGQRLALAGQRALCDSVARLHEWGPLRSRELSDDGPRVQGLRWPGIITRRQFAKTPALSLPQAPPLGATQSWEENRTQERSARFNILAMYELEEDYQRCFRRRIYVCAAQPPSTGGRPVRLVKARVRLRTRHENITRPAARFFSRGQKPSSTPFERILES